MKRIGTACTLVVGLVTASGAAKADWGALSSVSTAPAGQAGYGPPPGMPGGPGMPGMMPGMGMGGPGMPGMMPGMMPASMQGMPPGMGMPEGPGASGPYPNLMSAAAAPNDRPPDRYGFLPSIKKLFWWKKKGDCGSGDCGGTVSKGGGNFYDGGPSKANVNMGPSTQQGTLAFPHSPYVRSPRDYYMWGN